MNRHKEFMLHLLDLMEEYNVTISVEEHMKGWDSNISGIDFEFAPSKGIHSDYVSVAVGRHIDASDIRRAIARKWGMVHE